MEIDQFIVRWKVQLMSVIRKIQQYISVLEGELAYGALTN